MNINHYLQDIVYSGTERPKSTLTAKIRDLMKNTQSEDCDIIVTTELAHRSFKKYNVKITLKHRRFIYLNYDLLKFLFENCEYAYTIAPSIDAVFEITNRVEINFIGV